MERNKQHFFDFLTGSGTLPVLFEPFLSPAHAETLIWRRGRHLWDTAAAMLDTLTYLTERTQADMVFVDFRPLSVEQKGEMCEEMLKFRQKYPLGYSAIVDSADVPLAESAADCLCVYGDAQTEKIPVIRMDGTAENAILRGDCGWFCRDHAEDALAAYGDKIRILGGLGLNTLIDGSPVEIYSRVGRIAREFPGKWACGSGGMIPDDNYLELISLLGAFARIR